MTNPVPGYISGPLCPWGLEMWESGPPGWGGLESETVNMAMSPAGLEPPNICAGKSQQQL
jgi:hypothetical protein